MIRYHVYIRVALSIVPRFMTSPQGIVDVWEPLPNIPKSTAPPYLQGGASGAAGGSAVGPGSSSSRRAVTEPDFTPAAAPRQGDGKLQTKLQTNRL
jgi:hypothetical protein